jgi:hypothetical protein
LHSGTAARGGKEPPVAGVARSGPRHSENVFECYLDDLLVQTYSIKDFTGRIGFVVQDGEGTFSDLKAREMSLP